MNAKEYIDFLIKENIAIYDDKFAADQHLQKFLYTFKGQTFKESMRHIEHLRNYINTYYASRHMPAGDRTLEEFALSVYDFLNARWSQILSWISNLEKDEENRRKYSKVEYDELVDQLQRLQYSDTKEEFIYMVKNELDNSEWRMFLDDLEKEKRRITDSRDNSSLSAVHLRLTNNQESNNLRDTFGQLVRHMKKE